MTYENQPKFNIRQIWSTSVLHLYRLGVVPHSDEEERQTPLHPPHQRGREGEREKEGEGGREGGKEGGREGGRVSLWSTKPQLVSLVHTYMYTCMYKLTFFHYYQLHISQLVIKFLVKKTPAVHIHVHTCIQATCLHCLCVTCKQIVRASAAAS